jgi:hypothetical protein
MIPRVFAGMPSQSVGENFAVRAASAAAFVKTFISVNAFNTNNFALLVDLYRDFHLPRNSRGLCLRRIDRLRVVDQLSVEKYPTACCLTAEGVSAIRRSHAFAGPPNWPNKRQPPKLKSGETSP